MTLAAIKTQSCDTLRFGGRCPTPHYRVETRRFSVGGAEYEIDLCLVHSEAFSREVAAFVAVARRTGGR